MIIHRMKNELLSELNNEKGLLWLLDRKIKTVEKYNKIQYI